MENNQQLQHAMRFILSIILFLGGIFILVLRIPFWSLLLGIASIQVGIILIIFSFDQLGKWSVETHLEKLKKMDEEDNTTKKLKKEKV